MIIKTSNLLEQEAHELAQAGDSVRIAKEIKSRLLLHNRNTFLQALQDGVPQLITTELRHNELTDLLKSSGALNDDKHELSAIAEVEAKIAEYLKTKDKLQTTTLSALKRYELISKKVDEAIIPIDNLIDINRSQMLDLVSTTDKVNADANQMGIIILTAGSLILVLLIFGVVTSAGKPLEEISKVIIDFRTGNGSTRATISGFKEIRDIAENFNFMTERLEQTRVDQLQFIAAIAHDLRNPLNSISMATEVIMEVENEDIKEISNIIFRQTKNLDRLVGDLLDTTRIEAGHLQLESSTQEIGRLVEDAVELYRNGDSLHQFKINSPHVPILCSCDPARISQVMNNLLSNAIKYSPRGGTITLEIRSVDGKIFITVADQGIGIAAADLENIFKPFQRTKATKGTIPGIGLGLSTSRRIIEAHQGEMVVTSEIEQGSTFKIMLPALAKVYADTGRSNEAQN